MKLIEPPTWENLGRTQTSTAKSSDTQRRASSQGVSVKARSSSMASCVTGMARFSSPSAIVNFPLYIEARIELAKFEDCTEVSPPCALFKVPKRARADTLSSSQGGSVLKRSCLANTARSLKSSFALHAPATNATAVTLFFAQQSSDATTGIQSFTWPTEAIISSEVMIDNIPSNKGKSKFVFKVIYNELPYVAKRCYTGTPVSIIVNRNELIKEATTLGRAKIFLANFKDEYFEVTDFIIAREGVHRVPEDPDKSSFAPSLASGIKVSEYEALTDGEKDELVMIWCPL
ncbi:hypothetical protein B0H14DRAFT_2629979 [Mycena olivaceomarginata]|nr:hypothetical protein B0H14DRAFT_2629979 [Mycena olivaceomarginata]